MLEVELGRRWRGSTVLKRDLFSTIERGWYKTGGGEVEAVVVVQIGRAQVEIAGAIQERVLSPLSLIGRYGVEPVREGLLALDPLAPVHTVLRLDNASS